MCARYEICRSQAGSSRPAGLTKANSTGDFIDIIMYGRVKSIVQNVIARKNSCSVLKSLNEAAKNRAVIELYIKIRRYNLTPLEVVFWPAMAMETCDGALKFDGSETDLGVVPVVLKKVVARLDLLLVTSAVAAAVVFVVGVVVVSAVVVVVVVALVVVVSVVVRRVVVIFVVVAL